MRPPKKRAAGGAEQGHSGRLQAATEALVAGVIMASMIPAARLECSRPVYFDNADVADFPYWGDGTAFLCSWRECCYAVTAGHVLACAQAETVLIARDDRTGEFLPIDRLFRPNKDPDGYGDFALLRIGADAGAGTWRHDVLPLHDRAIDWGRRARAVPGARFVISGYPSEGR